MINIISGKFKRKKIEVPINDVRPTSVIKREAIFSVLESQAIKNSYELYKNKCFIDLFAGSGSLGLEAISRGASFTYFYEINNKVLEILLKNCKKLCVKNEYHINRKDITILKDININYPLSTIFIDPPYILNPFKVILEKILKNNILEKESIIVIEIDKKNTLIIPNQLEIMKEKIFGKTKIIFLKKLR